MTVSVVVDAIPFCWLATSPGWQSQSLPQLVSYAQYVPLLLQVALWLYSFGRKEVVLFLFALYINAASLVLRCWQVWLGGERPRPECAAPWENRFSMPNQEFFFVWSIATFLVAYCWMWTWMPATTVILTMLTLTVVYSVVAILLGLCTWVQGLVGAALGVLCTALFMGWVRTYLARRVEFLMGLLRPMGYEDHWLAWATGTEGIQKVLTTTK